MFDKNISHYNMMCMGYGIWHCNLDWHVWVWHKGPLTNMRLRAMTIAHSSTLIGGRHSRSKYAPHYAWGPMEYICECKVEVKFTWIPTWHRTCHLPWWLGLFSKTTWRQAHHKPGRSWHSKRSQPLIQSILSCVRTHMNKNSLKQHLVEDPVHMTSHYTWGPVSTQHDLGGGSGRPLDTFFWALTFWWSRLLARVWSGPSDV